MRQQEDKVPYFTYLVSWHDLIAVSAPIFVTQNMVTKERTECCFIKMRYILFQSNSDDLNGLDDSVVL